MATIDLNAALAKLKAAKVAAEQNESAATAATNLGSSAPSAGVPSAPSVETASAQMGLLPAPSLPVNPALAERNPQLVAQVQELSEMLHKQQPGIDTWLEQIHVQLRAYPELVHILTPEQVGALCSGWMQRTQVAVVKTATKARSGKAVGKLVKLSDDDI